ncbi:MAG: TapB family protein [Bacteroidia bacterium]
MKKHILLFAALGFMLISMVPAEVCESDLFVMGTVVTKANYYKKGLLMFTNTETVKGVSKTGSSTTADIYVTTVANLTKTMVSTDTKIRCENGSFYIDMNNLISQYPSLGAGVTAEFEGIDIEYPGTMLSGSKLPDAKLKMTTKSDGEVISVYTVTMTNRKVIGKEDKTTKAGKFDCWKIEYDMNVEIVMMQDGEPTNTPAKSYHCIEWFTSKTGIVYSENYKEDKLESHSEIISIKKGQ